MYAMYAMYVCQSVCMHVWTYVGLSVCVYVFCHAGNHSPGTLQCGAMDAHKVSGRRSPRRQPHITHRHSALSNTQRQTVIENRRVGGGGRNKSSRTIANKCTRERRVSTNV